MTTIKSAAKIAHSKLVAGAMTRTPSGRFAAKAEQTAASGEATAASGEATAASGTATTAASGEGPRRSLLARPPGRD